MQGDQEGRLPGASDAQSGDTKHRRQPKREPKKIGKQKRNHGPSKLAQPADNRLKNSKFDELPRRPRALLNTFRSPPRSPLKTPQKDPPLSQNLLQQSPLKPDANVSNHKIIKLDQLGLKSNQKQKIGGISVLIKDSKAPQQETEKLIPEPSTNEKNEVYLKKLNSFCHSEWDLTSATRIDSTCLVSPYIAAFRRKVYKMKPLTEPEEEIAIPKTVLEGKCKCKTSNCLKLYCECFKSLRQCNDECACVDCKNGADSEAARMKAIKRVLTSKYGKTRFQSVSHDNIELETPDASLTTPSIAVLKVEGSACQCRKSNCSNKYCGCHSRGKLCTKECGCVDCRNN